MGNKAQSPSGNPYNMYLGAGAIYYNFGLAGEVLAGATKGGSNFKVEREFKSAESDGDYGDVKGQKKKKKVQPVMTINAMELSKENLIKFYAGLDIDTSDDTYDIVTERIDIKDSDYIDNVAFIGENYNGDDIIIIIENVLGDGSIEMAMSKDEEIVPSVPLTAHYLRDDNRNVPYRIMYPKTDTTAPTVTVNIADGANNVAVNTSIIWTFDEAMDASTLQAGNFIIIKADGIAVNGTLTSNAAKTIVTFTPSGNLVNTTDYMAVVTTNVKDSIGNSLAENVLVNFTTVA